ncbi:hypothetical protein GDO81_011523 [Engystomops pustulosus]|uniref:N-acetyltransferase ESCO1 n=3 Tax=Engystomops pustulosus TaxID=76066 RepID=A0AAV7BFD0_ENGPU|nr:hypothetical protein GDO81_011523 [Engystomops pustulosus]
MTSKKRKLSSSETPAKSQKKETKGPPVASKKRNGVANKSQPGPTQNKTKSPLPKNKAIKKSQSSQSDVGRKKKPESVNVNKKSNGKNVPAKQRALPKDVSASKKRARKTLNNTSKATKKDLQTSVRKTPARVTATQSKSPKIVKSSAKSQSVKHIKSEPVKKPQSKLGLRSTQANKVAKKADRTIQTKEKTPSKVRLGRNKQTTANNSKESLKRTSKNTKSDCKRDTGRPTETAKKLSSAQRTNRKPSTALKEKASTLDKKKPGIKQTRATKKSVIREKKEVATESPEIVNRTCPVQPEVGSNEVVKNESQDCDKSTSQKTCTVVVPSPTTAPSAGTTSSTVPLKRKRDSNKPVIKTRNNVKKQKVVKSKSDKIDALAENEQKSKRISILDLCNEIAGEIESDTVEVVKEAPATPSNPAEDSVLEKDESPMEAPPPPPDQSPAKLSKRFFPSRKPLQVKSRIEQKTSPLTKKSKWNKIKLKKNFSPNMLRSHTVLPNLEFIKAKVSAQTTVTETKTSKKPDVALTTDIKCNAPLLSEKVKKDASPSVEGEQETKKPPTENGLLENHVKHELEVVLDEGFRLHLDSSPENSPVKKPQMSSPPVTKVSENQCGDCKQLTDQMAASAERENTVKSNVSTARSKHVPSDAHLQKEIKKLKEAEKDSSSQPIIDAGQKRFGAITCNICGMLYTASNPEDETQHLLFHNQFISAVKYVGWKKERIVAEYPDGKIIMVLPDDPKYALKKVEEIREMVDNDLGFQQAPLRLHSRMKTLMFINSDKKVVGCLIAEHIQWGYRVIDDNVDNCDKDRIISERVKAWCCSTTSEPALCGISRIWVFSMMRRKKIASRMLECLRNHFIYGSHLSKDEIAFSDPTPDGKLFATHYCGTSQFLVYNFISGHNPSS